MSARSADSGGCLVLVGTPLGNRADLSPRAREAIAGADLLLCEDTRSPVRLLGGQSELPPRVSCFVGNEHERVELMKRHLEAGERVVYVSEAGMPVWSDPGRTLAAAAIEAGFPVDVVPGPTAAATAVCLSGFAAEQIRFVGFVPRSGSEREALLASTGDDRAVVVAYESPRRTRALLADWAKALGPAAAVKRRAVVARELTKLHQEVLRGTVAGLAESLPEALKGEVTVVVEGAGAAVGDGGEGEGDPVKDAARRVLDVVLDPSLKPRARARALAALTGDDARALYARLMGLRSGNDDPES